MVEVVGHFDDMQSIVSHLLLGQTVQGLHPLAELLHVDLRVRVVDDGVDNIGHRHVQTKRKIEIG